MAFKKTPVKNIGEKIDRQKLTDALKKDMEERAQAFQKYIEEGKKKFDCDLIAETYVKGLDVQSKVLIVPRGL